MASKVRQPGYQPRPGLEGICRDHRCNSLRLPDVARNNAHHRVLPAEMPRQDLIPSLDLWAACEEWCAGSVSWKRSILPSWPKDGAQPVDRRWVAQRVAGVGDWVGEDGDLPPNRPHYARGTAIT